MPSALNGSRHHVPPADCDGDCEEGEASTSCSPRSRLERRTLSTYFGAKSVPGALKGTASRAVVVTPSPPEPEPAGCTLVFCSTCAAYAAREEERARQQEAHRADDKAERDDMRAEMRASLAAIQAQWTELRHLFFAPLTAADRRDHQQQLLLARAPSLTKAGIATPSSVSETHAAGAEMPRTSPTPRELLSLGRDPRKEGGKRLPARPVRPRVRPPLPYDALSAPNGVGVTSAGPW